MPYLKKLYTWFTHLRLANGEFKQYLLNQVLSKTENRCLINGLAYPIKSLRK